LFEKHFDPRAENIVTFAIIEESTRQLESVFSDLADIRALADLNRRFSSLLANLKASAVITESPTQSLRKVLPTLEAVLTAARTLTIKRLFVNPKLQAEVARLLAQFNRRETEIKRRAQRVRDDFEKPNYLWGEAQRKRRNRLITLAREAEEEKTAFWDDLKKAEDRLLFNNLCSQLDPIRTKLLVLHNELINPSEVAAKAKELTSLRNSYDDELNQLAAQVPSLCIYTPNGTPNKNVSFFVSRSSSDREHFQHTQEPELYDTVARSGYIYEELVRELDEARDYLEGLLVEYQTQCTQLEDINRLVRAGNVFSATALFRTISKRFVGVRYADFGTMLANSDAILREADALERRVKRSRGMIIGALMTKGKREALRIEYYTLFHKADALPECELRTEVFRTLASINQDGHW
jgi:hypothetical protein